MAKNLVKDNKGRYSFDVYFHDDKLDVSLSIIGKFNVYNALAAIAAIHANGIDLSNYSDVLNKFQNASRRFEILKK